MFRYVFFSGYSTLSFNLNCFHFISSNISSHISVPLYPHIVFLSSSFWSFISFLLIPLETAWFKSLYFTLVLLILRLFSGQKDKNPWLLLFFFSFLSWWFTPSLMGIWSSSLQLLRFLFSAAAIPFLVFVDLCHHHLFVGNYISHTKIHFNRKNDKMLQTVLFALTAISSFPW